MPLSSPSPRRWRPFILGALLMAAAVGIPAQQMVTETRDPNQPQDEEFARLVREWTTESFYLSPLVDHLPKVPGVPTPKDVLGYHIGQPETLTYYADALRYYRALEHALPNRVTVETIGRSDEDRELVVVWISSDENMRNLQQNRDRLAKVADPRGLSEAEVKELIANTKPQYHLIGGLHSGETGPSEMLIELAYRLATETSPLISQIRDNVYVSITPQADPDGRDRNVDWFYRGLEQSRETGPPTGGGRGGAALPYWGKYVFHDNNRDINLSQVSMRALVDWYFTAYPPIMHDLHESLALLYSYSGAAPQNPNLDPILFAELPFFSNFELAQMTKYGMPGVYTHAFMDGWSPGYLGSVAYNHNGMMRMYETQSGNDTHFRAQQARQGTGAPSRDSGQAPSRDSGQAPSTGSGQAAAGGATASSAGAGQASSTGAGQAPAGRGRGGRGAAAPAQTRDAAETPAPQAVQGGRGAATPSTGSGQAGPPTGRGGGQPREWYRGIPVPPGAAASFSRRNNTNYMQTGVLSALQLTSMFPNLVVENFYRKTQNALDAGKNDAPHGYVIPVQRDMTRVATLVNLLRVQRIEVGEASRAFTIGEATYPAGSFVVKRDQPYGRLAKNLLERQDYPDPNLRTYDDSGWTMGLALNVEVKEIADKAILDVAVTPVEGARPAGRVAGSGNAGIAVAHYGSTNMIALRYRLRDVPMRTASAAFTAGGVEFPAGSLIVSDAAHAGAVRAAIEELGLTAAALTSVPAVAMHDADPPRIAIYSSWDRSTQEIGWVRFTFDQFGVPYDLIYKERPRQGSLRADYDVIVMPTQTLTRQAVFAPPAARPVPYMRDEKYKFLGMYGESPDITGGMGGEGVDAFAKFLDGGGTLITLGNASRFPTEFGFARSVDASGSTSATFYAPRPLVEAEILRPEHPVFYGYTETRIPVKYLGGPLMSVAQGDSGSVLGRYVGGEAAVLSGLMRGADEIRERPFAIDVPGGFTGRGRVVLFANNPIYRWQNHGEFNMVFNAILNWNDLAGAGRAGQTTTTAQSGR
jgi:8-oxo-dGTP pyrophosphatase MutT (NUDIX family)